MRHGFRPSAPAAAALSLAVLGVAGCSAASPASGPAGAVPAAERTTRVIVQNESEWSLRIYALVGGAQYFLGSLEGFSERVFELSRGESTSTGDFRLAAVATGPVRNYYSNTVIVERGDTVRWTVLRSFLQTLGTIRVS